MPTCFRKPEVFVVPRTVVRSAKQPWRRSGTRRNAAHFRACSGGPCAASAAAVPPATRALDPH